MKQEKQNPFIKYNGIKDAKVHIHKTSGLYDASNEHDACGVGMIVDIHGNKSHELVDSALKVLENMKHRGSGRRRQQDGRRGRHHAPDSP